MKHLERRETRLRVLDQVVDNYVEIVEARVGVARARFGDNNPEFDKTWRALNCRFRNDVFAEACDKVIVEGPTLRDVEIEEARVRLERLFPQNEPVPPFEGGDLGRSVGGGTRVNRKPHMFLD